MSMGTSGWEGEVGEGWVGVEAQDGLGEGELPGYEQHEHDLHDTQLHEREPEHEAEGERDEYDGDAYGYEEEEDDGGFSDVLADAILKRPESMRVRSRKSRDKDKERPPAPAEFTFPSISDFGNVHAGVAGGYLDWEREQGVGGAILAQVQGEGAEEALLLADPNPTPRASDNPEAVASGHES
jgi:hypothetical protein